MALVIVFRKPGLTVFVQGMVLLIDKLFMKALSLVLKLDHSLAQEHNMLLSLHQHAACLKQFS